MEFLVRLVRYLTCIFAVFSLLFVVLLKFPFSHHRQSLIASYTVRQFFISFLFCSYPSCFVLFCRSLYPSCLLVFCRCFLVFHLFLLSSGGTCHP